MADCLDGTARHLSPVAACDRARRIRIPTAPTRAVARMRVASLGNTLQHLRREVFLFTHVILVSMVTGQWATGACGPPFCQSDFSVVDFVG